MADSMEMAGLAFGAPRHRGRRAAIGLGAAARKFFPKKGRGGHRKKPRHHKGGPPTRHHRGITLSNEFVKTFILVNMIRGMHT